jgi:hypothetical protein
VGDDDDHHPELFFFSSSSSTYGGGEGGADLTETTLACLGLAGAAVARSGEFDARAMR